MPLLEPTGLPIGSNTETEAIGVYLLAHLLALLLGFGLCRCRVVCTVDLVADDVGGLAFVLVLGVDSVVDGPVDLGGVDLWGLDFGELIGSCHHFVIGRLSFSFGFSLGSRRFSAWAVRRRDRRPERSARRRLASTRRDRLALTASMRVRRNSKRSAGRRLTMIVMCDERLRMRVARPRARGRQRLAVVPSSA